MGAFAWKISLLVFRLGTLAWHFRLGASLRTSAWKRSIENVGLELVLRSLRFGTFALELSLWNVRFGTFALELAFNNFRLETIWKFRETSVWKFHSDHKRLGSFVWECLFGISRFASLAWAWKLPFLVTLVWDLSLWIFGLKCLCWDLGPEDWDSWRWVDRLEVAGGTWLGWV